MKKYIEYSVISIVSLVAMYFLLNWTIEALVHSRDEVIVPKIQDRPLEQAINILSAAGLGMIKTGDEFNPSVPTGAVMKQDPSAGMTVRSGKMIKVTLSMGGDVVFVPDIVGQRDKSAAMVLRQRHLGVGSKNTVYSIRYDKNIVISMSPEPDTIVAKNTPVDITVSLGPPPEGIILMPNFTGMDVAEVRVWAGGKGINPEIVEKNDFPGDTVQGSVIGQEPQPDTMLTQDIPVIITVAGSATGSIAGSAGIPGEGKVFQKLPPGIHYEVPQGSKEQRVRVVLIDGDGERKIFEGLQQPGSKIDLPVQRKGKAKIRIFLNNVLIEERDL
ncbi:MAG: PASTA domain-containing protein [Elusimicrobia bacterium]|nr:PASTA domain-containing protein [Elusimicrobiota bacterium]